MWQAGGPAEPSPQGFILTQGCLTRSASWPALTLFLNSQAPNRKVVSPLSLFPQSWAHGVGCVGGHADTSLQPQFPRFRMNLGDATWDLGKCCQPWVQEPGLGVLRKGGPAYPETCLAFPNLILPTEEPLSSSTLRCPTLPAGSGVSR